MMGSILIWIQMLIILCTIGYKNFFFNKHFYILVTLATFSMISCFWLNEKYILLTYVAYYLLLFIFSYFKLKSFFLVSIFFLIQNLLLMSIWIIVYDFPNLIIGTTITVHTFLSYAIQIIFLVLGSLILNIINNRNRVWINIVKYSKNWTVLGIIIFISNNFLLLYRQYIIATNEIIIYLYLSVILFVYSGFLLLLIFFINKTYEKLAFIEQLKAKSEENSKFIELANEFQHDYKTFIFSTKRYLELNDIGGLKSYLNSLENYSSSLLNHSLLSQAYNIKDPAIQGLLLLCIEECEAKGIKLFLSIEDLSTIDFFTTIDFARCLSILITNSLEHSTEKIYIKFSHSNGISSCTVKNTYNKTINIENIFQRNFSTKKKHRGIGLSILSNIIKSYTNASLEVEIINKWISFTIKYID